MTPLTVKRDPVKGTFEAAKEVQCRSLKKQNLRKNEKTLIFFNEPHKN
jgi:hypothetical protein